MVRKIFALKKLRKPKDCTCLYRRLRVSICIFQKTIFNSAYSQASSIRSKGGGGGDSGKKKNPRVSGFFLKLKKREIPNFKGGLNPP